MAKNISLEGVVAEVISDVKKLMNVAGAHGGHLRELFASSANSVSKAELLAAVASIKNSFQHFQSKSIEDRRYDPEVEVEKQRKEELKQREAKEREEAKDRMIKGLQLALTESCKRVDELERKTKIFEKESLNQEAERKRAEKNQKHQQSNVDSLQTKLRESELRHDELQTTINQMLATQKTLQDNQLQMHMSQMATTKALEDGKYNAKLQPAAGASPSREVLASKEEWKIEQPVDNENSLNEIKDMMTSKSPDTGGKKSKGGRSRGNSRPNSRPTSRANSRPTSRANSRPTSRANSRSSSRNVSRSNSKEKLPVKEKESQGGPVTLKETSIIVNDAGDVMYETKDAIDGVVSFKESSIVDGEGDLEGIPSLSGSITSTRDTEVMNDSISLQGKDGESLSTMLSAVLGGVQKVENDNFEAGVVNITQKEDYKYLLSKLGKGDIQSAINQTAPELFDFGQDQQDYATSENFLTTEMLESVSEDLSQKLEKKMINRFRKQDIKVDDRMQKLASRLAVAEDSFQQIQTGQARRIEDSHDRIERVHQNLVQLDAEHSALLVHHKELSHHHANSEKTFFSAVDHLVNVIDTIQTGLIRHESHAVQVNKKITQLSKGIQETGDEQRAAFKTKVKGSDDLAAKQERERAKREANIRTTSELFSMDDTVVDHHPALPSAQRKTGK